MRNIVIVVALIIGAVFLSKAYEIWQKNKILLHNNVLLQKNIEKIHADSKDLGLLENDQIDEFEHNYRSLDQQMRYFGRYQDIKTALILDNPSKDGSIANLPGPSMWLGIKEAPLHINFYDLKGSSQFIRVLQFLKVIEASNPLRITNIFQKNNQLEVAIKLYGR